MIKKSVLAIIVLLSSVCVPLPIKAIDIPAATAIKAINSNARIARVRRGPRRYDESEMSNFEKGLLLATFALFALPAGIITWKLTLALWNENFGIK